MSRLSLLGAWLSWEVWNFSESSDATKFLRRQLPDEVLLKLKQQDNTKEPGFAIRNANQIVSHDDIGYGKTKSASKIRYMFVNPDNQEEMKEKLAEYVSDYVMPSEKVKELLEWLVKGLKGENEAEVPEGHKQLLRYIKYGKIETPEEIRDLLYYYKYYAITGMFPKEFSYSRYVDYDKDFKEYRTLVLEGVGVHSLQGMACVYALAERGDHDDTQKPNIFALECVAELEYYGRGRNGKRNIPLAYEYYKKVVEMNEFHPRASWAIADLMLSYEKVKKDCGDTFVIEEFENYRYLNDRGEKVYNEEWYRTIIYWARKAARYGSPAGVNLIGLIIEADEKKFPSKYKGELLNESAMDHYARSAYMGYPFAYSNMAKYLSKKAKAIEEGSWPVEYVKVAGKKVQVTSAMVMKEALDNLKMAANYGIPYASNKVSQIYLGLDKHIVLEEVDHEKAYKYAQKAICYAKLMNHAYHPFFNIVKFFYACDDSPHKNEVSYKEQLEYLKTARIAASGIPGDEELKFLKELDELVKKIKDEEKGRGY